MHDIDYILDKYEPLIYYHIHKMGLWKQFPAYRDDMLQEGRMAIWKAFELYKDKKNVGAYINTTIRNALYDYVFKEMKLHLYDKNIPYVEGMFQVDFGFDAKGEYIKDEISEDKNSEILADYFIEGLTQKQVAEKHNITQQWVSTLVKRFRKRVINNV